MLGQLKNSNPQAFQEVSAMMNSGKSPDACLNELLASGRFTQADIQKAQNYLKNNNPKRF